MAHSSLIWSLFKALVHSIWPLRRSWIINDVHSFCAMIHDQPHAIIAINGDCVAWLVQPLLSAFVGLWSVTLYRIAFMPAQKPNRIGLLLTHKNGRIVTVIMILARFLQRSEAAPRGSLSRIALVSARNTIWYGANIVLVPFPIRWVNNDSKSNLNNSKGAFQKSDLGDRAGHGRTSHLEMK